RAQVPVWVCVRRARAGLPPRRARARRAPGRCAPRAVRGRRRVPGRGGLSVATTQDTEQRKPSASNGGGGGTKTMRYREALNEALREEMERDESVFIMGEDIGVFNGAFKVTQGLLEDFGEKRVRGTPLPENTIGGAGVGAAMIGLRPVVEFMTVNFSLLAMDQIVNSAA